MGLLLPIGMLSRLRYYLIFVAAEATGIYFLVSSIWYWVVTNKV